MAFTCTKNAFSFTEWRRIGGFTRRSGRLLGSVDLVNGSLSAAPILSRAVECAGCADALIGSELEGVMPVVLERWLGRVHCIRRR